MTSTIRLLRNYQVFSSEARWHTANLFLRELKRDNLKSNNQKLMMLRVFEEFVSATEDLALLLLAVSKRNHNNKTDLIKLLLLEEASRADSKQLLKKIHRVRTPKGLLKKLDIIPLEKLSQVLEIDESLLKESLEYLQKGIKATISNRLVKNEMLIRALNKIKHGHMVFLDSEHPDKLWFYDFRQNKRRRLYELRVNLSKAQDLVNNIQVISHALQGLIAIILQDFRYRIVNDKNMRVKTKKYWISELESTEI